MTRLIATFRPQAPWVNDSTYDMGDNTEFDATEAFLKNDLADIIAYKENYYSSDHLSIGQPCREEHDGPFEVDADVDDWLEQNGVPERKTMTVADLQRLRDTFGVTVEI